MLLGKIKIHEIAKKFGLTSKEVLEVAKKLNIVVKSHLSGVEEEEANKIEKELSKKGASMQEENKSAIDKKKNKKKKKKQKKKKRLQL